MKPTYLVANWKANKTTAEAASWLKAVKAGLPVATGSPTPIKSGLGETAVAKTGLSLPKKSTLINIVCPSLIHLQLFREQFPQQTLGAQDFSPYGDGAYTGQTTARMLASLINYVILGHSERRRYFHETDQTVALKVDQALANHLTPIVSVDQNNLSSQLHQFSDPVIEKLLIMFEPPEAISLMVGPLGQGKPASLARVESAVKRIRDLSPHSPILYGGSVKSATISPFLKAKWLDGVVVGSASLDAQEWLKIIQLTHEIRSP